jgi:hypothetical protein
VVSSFLNIRVKDIEAVYAEWSARGAQFLTPPKQHQYEKRCYIRDPDGHLIEVGQTTDSQGTGRPLTGPRVRPPRSPSEWLLRSQALPAASAAGVMGAPPVTRSKQAGIAASLIVPYSWSHGIYAASSPRREHQIRRHSRSAANR